jgi:hypothetical protein
VARRKHKRLLSKRPQKYDTSFKDWISKRAQEILPLLLPGVEYEQTLNVEIIRSTMRADKVFKVQYYGQEHILHLEFETSLDDCLQSRLLVYNAVLYHDYQLPVMTLVLYPFRVKMAESPLLIANCKQEILRFQFQTVPLFTMDAEEYVQQHRTSMYPLLPTMRGVHADMIGQVLHELSELYRNDEVTLAQQFVWMELLLERTDTVLPVEKNKIQERLAMFDKLWEESPRVQKMREQFHAQYYGEGIAKGMMRGIKQGMVQGEIQTLRRNVMNVVQVRFPDLTAFAQEQVKLFDNPGALDLLFQKILVAPDIKFARWLLDSTADSEVEQEYRE